MLAAAKARDLVRDLARAAVDGGPEDWALGAARLSAVDGRTWLLLDEGARVYTYAAGAAVSGAKGWLGANFAEPSGFVAAITSFHTDGRIRQRAVQALADAPARLRGAALAVRALDHVPQVRDEALQVFLARLDVEVAEPALGVLLAGRQRAHAPAALDALSTSLLAHVPGLALVEVLVGSQQRLVRRWGFDLAHHHHLLDINRLIAAAASDPDQLVRDQCADWLVGAAAPADLRRLLAMRSGHARVTALTHLPDDELADDALIPMLADPTLRVRETAQWRARRRHLDLPTAYRDQFLAADTPRRRAACIAGLAEIGDRGSVDLVAEALGDASPRVRAAATAAVATLAGPSDAADLLTPLLLDASPRVATAAAMALARLGAGPAAAETAWTSPHPWNRRAAWRLSRASGSWNQIEADLRAGADADPQLSWLGHEGLRQWLHGGAATMYAKLEDPQRDRLTALLASATLDDRTRRTISFCAKIPYVPPPVAQDERGPAGRVLRFFRRR